MTPQQNEEPTKERLVIAVIAQIHRDLYDGEAEPLFEMLERVDPELLKGFLTEAEHHEKLRWN
jgi:hypothetical protein